MSDILSQLREIWDEIAKLTDWTWKNERRLDDVEARLLMLEKHQANLQRSNATWEDF